MHWLRPYLAPLLERRLLMVAMMVAGGIAAALGGIGLPWAMETVLPGIMAKDDRAAEQLLMVVILIPGVILGRSLALLANAVLSEKLSFEVLGDLRMRLFSCLTRAPIARLQNRHSGDLTSRVMVDADAVTRVVVRVPNEVLRQTLTLSAAGGALVWLSRRHQGLDMVVVCLLGVIVCALPLRILGKSLLRRAKRLQAEVGRLTTSLLEAVQAPVEVRALDLDSLLADRFRLRHQATARQALKVTVRRRLFRPAIDAALALAGTLAVVMASRARISAAELAPLLTAFAVCFEPIRRLGGVYATVRVGQASAARLEELLAWDRQPAEPGPGFRLAEPRGALSLRGVAFSFGAHQVLRNVDLDLNPGELVALVGASGSGKTTLLRLLLRLYEPDSGCIALDGVDLTRLDVQELRRTMAFVPQSPILLDDTVALNIEIGRPGASMEAVVEAAELAGAGELMHQLPAGLDTRVGERGIQLSGGQLQRLAIARAFLHGGRVLLLDEPTSAVDGAIEASLHTTLQRLARDRTVLIAAHRPSTVLLASRIAVLDSGRIVADGSHQQLLENCVPYRRLWRVEDSKRASRQTPIGHSPPRSLEKVG